MALRRVMDSGDIDISCATVSPVCVLSNQTVRSRIVLQTTAFE
jgi:hypothetical protein